MPASKFEFVQLLGCAYDCETAILKIKIHTQILDPAAENFSWEKFCFIKIMNLIPISFPFQKVKTYYPLVKKPNPLCNPEPSACPRLFRPRMKLQDG